MYTYLEDQEYFGFIQSRKKILWTLNALESLKKFGFWFDVHFCHQAQRCRWALVVIKSYVLEWDDAVFSNDIA